MSFYGYALVSTLDHDLAIQSATLKAAGREVIRVEKAGGTRRDGRSELQALLDFLCGRDTLVVTRIDRLARSLKGAQDIVHERKAEAVALKATERPVDPGTAPGKAFLDTLGIREFEANLRRERRLEGIADGVYKARKPTIDADEVWGLCHDEKLGLAAIARRLGIGRARIYRALRKPVTGVTNGDGHAHQG